jgi:hypothetical protein
MLGTEYVAAIGSAKMKLKLVLVKTGIRVKKKTLHTLD